MPPYGCRPGFAGRNCGGSLLEQLFQIIQAYLDVPHADYALMVEGPWGSGKTFFWRNSVKPLIEQPSRDGAPTRRTVYVSLYGLSTAEDIDREIAYALYPALDNKGVKLAAAVGRVLSSTMGIDLSQGKVDFATWLNLDNVTICFDDLERCSMPVADVLGYINQYVEHRAVRTLILCNEAAIADEKRKEYDRIKEKVVGQTVRFRLDHQQVLDSIISTYNKEEFGPLLRKVRDLLLQLFKQSGLDNIRILKRALSHLRTVFRSIERPATYSDELLESLVRLVLPVTFEHLSARGTRAELREIATGGMSLIFASLLDAEDAPSYQSQYASRYSDEKLHDVFKSHAVFTLITDGFWDAALFTEELREQTEKKSDLQQAIEELIGLHAPDDAKFLKSWAVIREGLSAGRITSMRTLFQIFGFAHFWAESGVIENSPVTTERFFQRVVREGLAAGRFSYDADLNEHLSLHGEHSPVRTRFRRFLAEKNDALKRATDTARATRMLEAMKAGADGALRELMNDLWDVPVLAVLKPKVVAEVVAGLPNDQKQSFCAVIEKRYRRPPTLTTLAETAGLRKLRDELRRIASAKRARPIPFSILILGRIVRDLNIVIEHYEAHPKSAKPPRTKVKSK
jgi:hypothetical protein